MLKVSYFLSNVVSIPGPSRIVTLAGIINLAVERRVITLRVVLRMFNESIN